MRAADPGVVRNRGRLVSPERVLSRAIDRLGRSSDASIYRLVPEAVVRPRDLGELRALVAYARSRGRRLTFRAAGTSLSGQAVSDDLLVELGPHWRAFRVRDGGRRVWAQPISPRPGPRATGRTHLSLVHLIHEALGLG